METRDVLTGGVHVLRLEPHVCVNAEISRQHQVQVVYVHYYCNAE